ncbi:MAG: lamin tail domain-containing protein [Phycisphaerae bacterium]|nr:lamin tail domain-containing protein [Phycisphaerae bacterium]
MRISSWFLCAFILLLSPVLVIASEIILVTSDSLSQQGYVDYLYEIYGQSVTVTVGNYALLDGNTEMLAELEAADLIIIARKSSSGDYDDGNEVFLWNSISTPMINHSAYLVRDVRWDWLGGAMLFISGQSDVVVLNSSDTIFAGMGVDDDDTITIFNGSQVNVAVMPLAAVAVAGLGSNSNTCIARWDNVGQPYYDGTTQSPGNKRLFFAMDEFNPMTTLTDQGKTLLKNALLSLYSPRGDSIEVIQSDESTEVKEKFSTSDDFTLNLLQQPTADVTITVEVSSDDIVLQKQGQNGQIFELVFTESNYNIPQVIEVKAIADDEPEGTENVLVSFSVSSSDENFHLINIEPINVTVYDSPSLYLDGDLDGDLVVGLNDLSIFAALWLSDGSTTDLIMDTTVNILDFGVMAGNWQRQLGPIILSEFMASNDNTILDGDGNSSDWIELYNLSDQPVDISGWHLTDSANALNKWQFPDNTIIAPDDYLIVFASNQEPQPYVDSIGYLHTNFKLSASGEYLALVASDGMTVLQDYNNEYPAQQVDISYGLVKNVEGYFGQPTPGQANVDFFKGFVGDTKFSHKRGYYNETFMLEISCKTSDAHIRYTIDGSEPTLDNGYDYTNAIPISTTTVLRAAAFKTGFQPSNVDTQTYIFFVDVINQQAPIDYPLDFSGFPADYEMDAEIYSNPAYGDIMHLALLSLPVMSIVTDKDNLFDPTTGIYLNTISEGIAWERPASVEYFDTTNQEQFQIDCGLRIQGGASRQPRNCPKHSFRLLFKDIYGATKLKFPLFGDDAVGEFDTIILRGSYNNSWHHWSPDQRIRAQYLRDQWGRNTQLAMGQASPHGIFVHLYVNGLYWGLYNPSERPEASFASSYYGGDKDDWDALNSSEPVDGNKDAWNVAQSIANAGVEDASGYEEIKQYVDVENLIDYMILNFYGGNVDWDNGNWYAARLREQGQGYKFFSWDFERTLENPYGDNVMNVNRADKPTRLFTALRNNEEFRILFADHVHRFMFNDGVLTPQSCSQRWMALANQIDLAVIAESARWGDYRRDMHQSSSEPYYLYTKNDFWLPEQQRLINDYFPVRTEVMIGDFREANLYPLIDAPVFHVNGQYQHGGIAEIGDSLQISGSGQQLIYTIDGSDPRVEGGQVNPEAVVINFTSETEFLIHAGAQWKYLDDGSDQGQGWFAVDYNDEFWQSGLAELGYGDTQITEIGYIDTDTEKSGIQKNAASYFRKHFNVADVGALSYLSLKVKMDDGAIVYINGQEIGRHNMPVDDLTYQSWALGNIADEDEFYPIGGQILPDVLVEGDNVIAVAIHQFKDSSSDVSFDLELKAVTNNSGQTEIVFDKSIHVRARIFDNGKWSALNEARYAAGPIVENLRVTELMYNPGDSEIGIDPNSEFIELQNIGTESINLNLVSFDKGIEFTFDDIELSSNEYIVIVRDQDAFNVAYPEFDGVIAGVYEGALDNAGERIRLLDAIGREILNFRYEDSWYDLTDGQRYSLTIFDPEIDTSLLSEGSVWIPSASAGGSPGSAY